MLKIVKFGTFHAPVVGEVGEINQMFGVYGQGEDRRLVQVIPPIYHNYEEALDQRNFLSGLSDHAYDPEAG